MRKVTVYERYFKRPLDVFCSGLALVVLSPVMGVTALMVRSKLGSPILFTQDRPGKDEKIFKLYKFRTMTDERDENGELLPDEVRLTKFGKLLRSTSLDELPSLINMLRGDISVVGPRPLLVSYLPYYTEQEHHRHDVRPGLTGLAQINGRNNLTWDQKFAYDIEYVNHITFWGDVKIVLMTALKVIKRSDIAVGNEWHGEKFLDLRAGKNQKKEEQNDEYWHA